MKIYLGGPMRGIDAYNFPAFYEAAKVLRDMGHSVFNPAEADVDRLNLTQPLNGASGHLDPAWSGQYLLDNPHLFSLRAALAEDLDYIVQVADAIVLLPGYQTSSGVKAERAAAEALGLDLYLFRGDDQIGYADEVLIPLLEWEEAKRRHPSSAPRDPSREWAVPVEDLRGLEVHMTPDDVLVPTPAAIADWDAKTDALADLEAAKDFWANERQDVLDRFAGELAKATGDGSKKRQSGEKPPWYEDGGHEGAIFSHLTKWKRGEVVDPDSGAHTLVHAAWRCLAIACSETGNHP